MADLLEMRGISKSFGRNKVLADVNFSVRAGEVHALCGENGAGKSTLVKILAGIYQPDSGEIVFDGEKRIFNETMEARRAGISIIHQELMLMPHLSIAENIFMGKELRNRFGLLDRAAQERKAQELLDKFNMDVTASARLGGLTIAQQQMVEIIRAISFDAKIIAMDEPTSSLSERESAKLFELIGMLRKNGVGIILISHRLNDIFTLADRVTVLRDGICAGTLRIAEADSDTIIKMMVGRDIKQFYSMPENRVVGDEIVLKVSHLSDGDRVLDAGLELRKGEILGVSGLIGAGRSEMMQCIFGLRRRTEGEVLLHGKAVSFTGPAQAIEHGIGYVCEDRKKQGLFLRQNVEFNTSINSLDKVLRALRYDQAAETQMAEDYAGRLETKITGTRQIVRELSGGNQQKVLISRWLACTSDILLLDEPTRGVDVKAKQDIYKLVGELTASGMSVVFVSSELTELLNICDRILVMSNGRTTGVLDRQEFDQEKIMKLATLAFQVKSKGEENNAT